MTNKILFTDTIGPEDLRVLKGEQTAAMLARLVSGRFCTFGPVELRLLRAHLIWLGIPCGTGLAEIVGLAQSFKVPLTFFYSVRRVEGRSITHEIRYSPPENQLDRAALDPSHG